MAAFRIETDSMGEVRVPVDRLWGAQTQRALECFAIGDDPMPPGMIPAYALVKKAAALVNRRHGRLDERRADLIARVCDELLAGEHDDQFPLRAWMSGSGTQFNMNVNEVIANRSSELAGEAPGSKNPVHPNDHANMSQSTNDGFPTAMHVAAATETETRLLPEARLLRDAFAAKARDWKDIVKIGRTHMQDAVPMKLGQEFSGYAAMLDDSLAAVGESLRGLYPLAVGGTAVGTGINAPPGFGAAVASEIARLTGLPFVAAANPFAAQGSHDALVRFHGSLKALAVSLRKIADDVRFLACGPRCGIAELRIPENEPGSSIMPGKVNPTQCEVLSMLSIQVMANDAAVAMGGCGGNLEMNAYKPLIILNVMRSIRLLGDGCRAFRIHLIEGTEPDLARIDFFLKRSLMLATSLSPVIGYDKAAETARYALDRGISLRDAALELAVVSAEEFDRIVDPGKMV